MCRPVSCKVSHGEFSDQDPVILKLTFTVVPPTLTPPTVKLYNQRQEVLFCLINSSFVMWLVLGLTTYVKVESRHCKIFANQPYQPDRTRQQDKCELDCTCVQHTNIPDTLKDPGVVQTDWNIKDMECGVWGQPGSGPYIPPHFTFILTTLTLTTV